MEDFQLRLLIENLSTIVAITGILGFVALGPVGRALARRIEGRSASPDEFRELQLRLEQLERNQHQVAELDERIDFAERLLAERSEAGRLPPGRG